MQKGLKLVKLQLEYRDTIEKKCISMRYISGRIKT